MAIPNGTLLAEDAQEAAGPGKPCAICRHPILAGHRIARLVRGGGLAHILCINRAALRRRAAQ